jgi:hypothetical protein
MTRAEMLSRMSSAELSEWIEYDSVNPIGLERIEWAIAMLTCMFANVHLKKGAPPLKIEDFVLDHGGLRTADRPAMTAQQIMDALAPFKRRGKLRTKGPVK